jgi:hypothetical protein
MRNASDDNARLVHALRQHQAILKEVLEAIERRDMTPSQIREHLGWVAEGLKNLRKDARLLEK